MVSRRFGKYSFHFHLERTPGALFVWVVFRAVGGFEHSGVPSSNLVGIICPPSWNRESSPYANIITAFFQNIPEKIEWFIASYCQSIHNFLWLVMFQNSTTILSRYTLSTANFDKLQICKIWSVLSISSGVFGFM